MDADTALAADWRSRPAFIPTTVWAKKQGHTWFAAEVTVPESARGKTFVLRFISQWQDRPRHYSIRNASPTSTATSRKPSTATTMNW